MRYILTALMITLLAATFSQPCAAQFEDADPAGGTGTPAGPIALGFKVGVVPTSTFRNSEHGLTLESTGGVTPGLHITKVDRLSLAERNGLEPGDVIMEIDHHAVSTQSDLQHVLRGISKRTHHIDIRIINVRDGLSHSFQYELETDAGMYQTNFGRVELTQTPTNTPGITLLKGTMHFYHGATSEIEGTLSGNRFTGTSTNSSGKSAKFELTRSGKMFEGHVTQGRRHKFVFIKRN